MLPATLFRLAAMPALGVAALACGGAIRAAPSGSPACAMALDPTFGLGGVVTLVNPPNARPGPGTLAFEPDGKILIAASDPTGTALESVAVARFDASGAIDATYGAGGFARLAPPGTVPPATSYPGGLLVQPDGKSVVVDSTRPALARFDRDGTIDTSFGAGGYVTPAFLGPLWLLSPALLDDGSVLVVGTAGNRNGTMFLAKYGDDGAVDTTFGMGGAFSTPSMNKGRYVLGGTDGSFLVAGDAEGTPLRAALERYSAAGALDATFGSAGTATAPTSTVGNLVVGVVRQSTGAIVLALSQVGPPPDADFVLVRFTPDGQPDPTFGDGGVVRTDFFGADDHAAGVSLAEGDALLVAGTVEEPMDDAGHSTLDFGIARYTADGQPTFAPGGKLVTRFAELSTNELDAQGLQADGKLVVAGYGVRPGAAGGDSVLTLARYACQ